MTAHATWILPAASAASVRDDATVTPSPRRNSFSIRPQTAERAKGQPGFSGVAIEPLAHFSDLDLLRAAANGNAAAFHSLMDRHAKNLFRLAVSLSATRSDAEDICQETFVGAYRGLGRFEAKASVKTWLTRILIRRAAKHWHKTRHERKTLSLHAAGDEESNDRQDGVPTTPSASPVVDHKIDLAAVIQRLAPEYRQVIVLREMQGLSYEEIAMTLAIPRGTVESRLHRARAELRVLLKDYKPTGHRAGTSVPRSAT